MASLRRGGTFVDVKEEVPEYAKKIDHGAKVEAVVSALVKVETPDRREIRRMKAEAVEPAGVKVETHEIRRMKAEEGEPAPMKRAKVERTDTETDVEVKKDDLPLVNGMVLDDWYTKEWEEDKQLKLAMKQEEKEDDDEEGVESDDTVIWKEDDDEEGVEPTTEGGWGTR